MLRIRKSSYLFRLRTASDVMARVRFLNTGRAQIPGVIVMMLTDEMDGSRPIDPEHSRIAVVMNATREEVTFEHPDLEGGAFELHPVQKESHDELVKRSSFDAGEGSFTVPARTAAVFVEG
jgi:pullulanase